MSRDFCDFFPDFITGEREGPSAGKIRRAGALPCADEEQSKSRKSAGMVPNGPGMYVERSPSMSEVADGAKNFDFFEKRYCNSGRDVL